MVRDTRVSRQQVQIESSALVHDSLDLLRGASLRVDEQVGQPFVTVADSCSVDLEHVTKANQAEGGIADQATEMRQPMAT